MRIAVGGYEHETNTFSTLRVSREKIEKEAVSGQALIDRNTGVHCMTGGSIDACRDLGIELVPGIRVDITPCDMAEKDAFEFFLKEFTDQLWRCHCEKPLDAIALNIHGAAVADGYPDAETAMLKALRERFGNDIPIGMVLDLHGNITPDMIRLSSVSVGFKTYPHIDNYESAYKVIRLLYEQVKEGRRFYQALVPLPWHIAPAFGSTLSGPAHDIMLYNDELVRRHPGLRDVTFFHGFPYADVPFSGASVTAVADTPESARKYALEAARYAWSRRHDFAVPLHSAREAMDLAEKADGLAVINEGSDNPGGGAPGDGTHLLKEMLRRDLPASVYGSFYDPDVARLAAKAGPGNRIDCLLGGKTDRLHGDPIKLEGAYVKTLSDGAFIRKNPMGAGGITRLGLTALIMAGNVGIVVTEGRRQTLDDGPFRIVGIDWRDMRIIALKSSQHFKGWWAERAGAIISCDSPGIHSADLSVFDYRYLNKEYYPFKEKDPDGPFEVYS